MTVNASPAEAPPPPRPTLSLTVVWLGLCGLAGLSLASVEHPVLVGAAALLKFVLVGWLFMELNRAHRGWSVLLAVIVAAWFAALAVLK